MKLYNWIDSYFDSKEKRRIILALTVSIYWLWQNIWQCIFYAQLLQLKDYQSLFSFFENMEQFNQALLVNVLYELIMRSTMPMEAITTSILSQFKFLDILLIGCTLLLWISNRKQRIGYLFLILIGVNLIFILLGLHATSLVEVMKYLNGLALGSIGLEIVIIGGLSASIYTKIRLILAINCA